MPHKWDKAAHVHLKNRVFLNLWFGKPMVSVRVAFHENDGNHENDETMKTAQTATNKELTAGFAEIKETTKMTKTTQIQGANHRLPKPHTREDPPDLPHGFPLCLREGLTPRTSLSSAWLCS